MQCHRHLPPRRFPPATPARRWVSLAALVAAVLPACAGGSEEQDANASAGQGNDLGAGGGSTSGGAPGSGGEVVATGGLGTGGASVGSGGTGVGSGGTVVGSGGQVVGMGGQVGTGGQVVGSGGQVVGSGGQVVGTGGQGDGGSGTGGDQATGGSASGESTCLPGVDTGDACNPVVDTAVCERSDRTCVCGLDSLWTCTPIGQGGTGGTGGNGTGGDEGTGGDPGTGGEPGTGGSAGSGGGTVQKFVGNIDTRNGGLDVDGRTYSDYWDQITPENAGKWGSVQSTAGSSFNWRTLDAIYAYTQEHNIVFKEHTFLWGPQQPSGAITEADVRNWMQEFCARYPDTRVIDVVNEPPPHTEPAYSGAIGGGTNGNWQWIANAFEWADEACPNAILMLNDYNNVEWRDQTAHFIDIVNTIQAAGAPIDAVGAQSHGLSDMVSTSTMIELMTRLHDETGLPVYVTEYDINLNDDAAQLDKYQQHFGFFLDTEWIHGITLWGWIYGSTWVPNSGLIRNGTPRPAMTWLMEQLDRPAP